MALQMSKNIIIKVWLAHLAFHTLWVAIFLVSLLGVFLLLPLVGWYNAFILGFLGNVVLGSPFNGVLLGYIVFSVTGFVSGWLISLVRPKRVGILTALSLVVTIVLLISASWMKITSASPDVFGSPESLTSGDAGAAEIVACLKTAYDLTEPPVPPFASNKGPLIPLSELQPMLLSLHESLKFNDGSFMYCNLPSSVWIALRARRNSTRYPLAWSLHPSPGDERLVIVVDLQTDILADQKMSDGAVTILLTEMEEAAKTVMGDSNLKLHLK